MVVIVITVCLLCPVIARLASVDHKIVTGDCDQQVMFVLCRGGMYCRIDGTVDNERSLADVTSGLYTQNCMS